MTIGSGTMAGMNTTVSTTIWSLFGEPDRLDPNSPLARDVLGIDPIPSALGWTLDNHYVNRLPRRREPNAFERAHALAKHGRRI